MKTYNLASPGTALCGYQAVISQLPEHLIPKAIILGLGFWKMMSKTINAKIARNGV